MPFRAILFDLDGTLLDTLDDLADSANEVLAGEGFPSHPVDAYRHFIGNGAARLFRRALPERARDDKTLTRCLHTFGRVYQQRWNVKTKPYPGVPELLDALKGRNVAMAILSNKPHEFTVKCAQNLLPDWTFDAVYGQRDGIPIKPDPTAALEVAEKLAAPAKEFIYLGDSGVDMQTAVRAGMLPLGALWGFRDAEDLRGNGAAELLKHPTQLLDLFD